MAAPTLVPLGPSDRAVLPAGAGLPAVEAQELFLVVVEGEFAGRVFAAGDLLVCGGRAHHGDLVVLVPRGHGRPRLGSIKGARLLGDAGEPCHEVRWRIAGRLVSVVREPGVARSLRPPAAPRVRGTPAEARAARPPAAPRALARPSGQLSLFGAAA